MTLAITLWTGTSPPKVEALWECEGSFPHTFFHSRASLLARNLASPCLGCEPKARLATFKRNIVMSQQQTNHSSFWDYQKFIYFVFFLPIGNPWVIQNWFGNVNILNKGSKKLLSRWNFISLIKSQLLFIQLAKD